MNGLFGKVLQIDLTKNRYRDLTISEENGRKFIGGKGLGLKILLDNFSKKSYSAFSPENPLIFMTGPFTNLGIPGSGRHVVISKSPLTGFLGESYSGGYFGTYLKKTGYDGIVITGRSELPQYLIISPKDIIFGNAHNRGLMGKSPSQVQDILKKKYGDIRVSAIGAAGERLVRFACIINDRNRANGRCGLGAVMGYKNLKAIGVTGNLKPDVYDEKKYGEARKKYMENINSNSNLSNFGKYGTPDLIETLDERGILPTRNFQKGSFSGTSSITGEKLYDDFLTDRDSCSFCPIKCKRVVQGKFGDKDIQPIYGGPEYETIGAFGPLLGNDNLASICMANQLCNQYGLDTISTGNVIAFAMEARERSKIKDNIKWGDAEKIIELIHAIKKRKGLGKELGEGVSRFSKKIGGEDFAVHGKGLETPMHEPRGKKGLGMSYALSPRGCTHLEGLHDTMIEKPNSSPELGAVSGFNRFSLEKKVQVVKNFEDVRAFTNSLIQCVFTVSLTGKNYNVDILRELLYGITGEKLDNKSMLERGSLFYNMGREFSYLQGLRRSDDMLPKRFMNETLEFGDNQEKLSRSELIVHMKEYYKLRRWDSEGRPKNLKF